MSIREPAAPYTAPRIVLLIGAILGAFALSGLIGSSDALAHRSAVVLPEGVDWSADASALRGQNGQRFTFLCPADGETDRAWGTDVYTDDSSVCTAALHAGTIKLADGGMVTIEIRAGQASYSGSTSNGVTTEDFAAWPGSFVVVSANSGGAPAGVKIGGGDWDAKASLHRKHNGTRYLYICPSGGNFDTVWGTNLYTDDSSVCTAAVQVGVITAAAGGNVTIEIRPGRSSYAGFTAQRRHLARIRAVGRKLRARRRAHDPGQPAAVAVAARPPRRRPPAAGRSRPRPGRRRGRCSSTAGRSRAARSRTTSWST